MLPGSIQELWYMYTHIYSHQTHRYMTKINVWMELVVDKCQHPLWSHGQFIWKMAIPPQ